MMKPIKRAVPGLILGLSLSGHVLAQDQQDWEFTGSIYGWLPDLSGRTGFSAGPGEGAVEVPIGAILDNLEFTFQGAFLARKGRWGVYSDLIYLSVSKSQQVGEVPGLVDADASEGITGGTIALDVESVIATVAGSYRIGEGEVRNMDLIFGVRYLDMTQDLDFDLEGDIGDLPLPGPQGRARTSTSPLDVIVGVRGRLGWSEEGPWYTPYHFDIGTGDSDITWQAMLGVGYQFGWGDVAVVYRHMDYDFGSRLGIETLDFSGPALGAIIHW